jgi:hypothetical protein
MRAALALIVGLVVGFLLGHSAPQSYHCATLPNGTQICTEDR